MVGILVGLTTLAKNHGCGARGCLSGILSTSCTAQNHIIAVINNWTVGNAVGVLRYELVENMRWDIGGKMWGRNLV